MTQNVDLPTMIKNQIDAVAALTGVVAKDVGRIVVEAQDFSVTSFQHNAELMRKLVGVKSVSELIQLHTDHARASYEATVAKSKKIGELLTELSRDTMKTVAVGPEQASTPVKAPPVARRLQAAE
jgi:hypothetical protein